MNPADLTDNTHLPQMPTSSPHDASSASPDTCFFLGDGQPARGPGGTAETIEDARRIKIPARIIHAGTMEIASSE